MKRGLSLVPVAIALTGGTVSKIVRDQLAQAGFLSRSPPTARCRPARRRSPQGRSGATVDEHGLRFYGFLLETMECGVRAMPRHLIFHAVIRV